MKRLLQNLLAIQLFGMPQYYHKSEIREAKGKYIELIGLRQDKAFITYQIVG